MISMPLVIPSTSKKFILHPINSLNEPFSMLTVFPGAKSAKKQQIITCIYKKPNTRRAHCENERKFCKIIQTNALNEK